MTIPDARYWSPSEPNLYVATIRVAGEDEESVRFGMRELTIRNQQIELNGKTHLHQGRLFRGTLPDQTGAAGQP